MAESQFSSFFVRRPRPKHSFYCFPLVGHGRKPIFNIFRSSAAAESQFSAFSRFQPWMTNDFPWKLMIYPRIWTAFFENLQFTIVFWQFFLKIVNLLSYLSCLFWKSAIYYRIWTVFSENWWFTPVSEWFFPENRKSPPVSGSFSLSFVKAQLHIRNWSIGTLLGA